jgi:RNA polymerase sigma-70 factor (ECF subfamily)
LSADDPAGLQQAYFERRATLLRFFAARTGSASDAEDLVQELFLKLSTLETAVEVENPGAYLFRLASNLMLDRARQRRRSQARDSAYREATVERAAGQDVADQPDAEQTLAARQRLALLLARLGDLPEKTRAAFRLHKFEGLSHSETAARMGVSRSAVEKYISAALKHLLETGP